MMNHIRHRYLLPLLLKKLKFSPVVLIQGARQTGKSFLVRSLLPEKHKNAIYKSLDLNSTRQFAERNPDTFVRDLEPNQTLIIDEAQKVPALFDSVKAVVDEDRRPGKYILLGSTEFSKLTKIRESLTGRAAKIRLFPLTLSETKHLPLNTADGSIQSKPRVSRKDLLKYLANGGMPGIFGIRQDLEKKEALHDWIDLVAQRDALVFDKIKIEPQLIMRILAGLAKLEDSSAGALSKYLDVDLRKVKTHIEVLKTLFVIHQIEPHSLSTGKPQLFFCDVGFLDYFSASFEKK
jgi:predicted AAA+ superfamily ATPase